MSTRTFAPDPGPSFVVPLTWEWRTVRQEAIKPYTRTIPTFQLPVRRFDLNWRICTKALRDYVVSFFHRGLGSADDFYWTPPDPVWAPEDSGPDLDSTSGGSLSQRTYYVKHTWYDSTTGQETTASPASTITVPANYLLEVSVPIYPCGVGAWRVYASETQGDERLQAYATSRTWTEPVSGLVPDSAMVPTTNTLKPATRWRLVGSLQERKITANRYSLDLQLEEFWA